MLVLGPEEERFEVARFAGPAEARDGALVLASAGISAHLIRLETGFAIAVRPVDFDRAREELAAYALENRPRPHWPSQRRRPENLTAAMAYMAVLVIAFVVSYRQPFGVDWVSAGAATAGRILGGEWWRPVTALTLHADFGHLLSNVLAGGLFGILLAQLLGAGLAWLAILAAGVLGNSVNALFHSAGFSAVGASTAVFGAVGLLGALGWRHRASFSRGLRAWLPLAGGLMLLAYLGFGGERIDIGGHVAGFLAGVAVGAALHYGRATALADHRLVQLASGVAAVAAIGLAWAAALASG